MYGVCLYRLHASNLKPTHQPMSMSHSSGYPSMNSHAMTIEPQVGNLRKANFEICNNAMQCCTVQGDSEKFL